MRTLALCLVLCACTSPPARERRPPPTTRNEPPPTARSVGPPFFVAGGAHTCVRAGGPLLCWGKNDHAELGDRTRIERPTPTASTELRELDAIVFGETHACALVHGAVRCWGNNDAGQLGDGTTRERTSAAAVAGLPGAIAQVAAGLQHSCARTEDGAVFCWGDNHYLQVGTRQASAGDAARADDGHELVVRPRRVTLPAPAAQLFLHLHHSCAKLTTGALMCWGGHWMTGWLGDESVREAGREPTLVPDLAGSERIALGGEFVCGLSHGRVRCHGDNLNGQLGDPSADCCAQPPRTASVAGVTDATDIVAGDRYACVLRARGAVACWGVDLPGELGHEEGAAAHLRPFVPEGTIELAAGSRHTCARMPNDRIACWGDDELGQLGDGISRRVAAPVAVDGITDATALAVGNRFACVQTRAHQTHCWGVQMPRRHFGVLDATSGLQAGNSVCAISGSEARCAPMHAAAQFLGTIAGSVRFGFPIAQLALGGSGVCAIGRTGELACADELMVGDGIGLMRAPRPRTAAALVGGARVTAFAVADRRACGVVGTSVRCWDIARVNYGPSVPHLAGAPHEVRLDASDPPIGVALHDRMECAFTRAGRVFCWDPPITNGAPEPHAVADLTGVLEMTAGSEHICARTASAVFCWGNGEKGQLGGGAIASSQLPVRVDRLSGRIAQIDAGGEQTCARTEEGRVFCWGSDEGGALGRNTPSAPRGPVDVRR